MNIKYRMIQKGDAENLWNMMDALDHETTYMMYEPGERKKDLSRLETVIDSAVNGENFFIVAADSGEIIGYLSGEQGNLSRIRHSAYVVVGIRSKYQGFGIGTEFFKRLDDWAVQNHVTRLELTVMCPNERAKSLYEKFGYSVEGIKRNSMLLDGEYVDEYYMAKLL